MYPVQQPGLTSTAFPFQNVKWISASAYDTSNHTSLQASGLLLSSLCYAPLPIHNVQWSTPKWLKLHPEKKKCYYLNYGYSAVLQKTLNHPFFTIHDFYLPTWRKPATWAHRSGEDFTGVVLLFLWKKKWISLYFYVMWSMVSPAAEKMGQFEKWPWEVWIGKEFTQTWNEWPGLLQLFVPTHFM